MAAHLAGGKEGLKLAGSKKQAELENPSAFICDGAVQAPALDALEGNPDAPLIVERVYYTVREADWKPMCLACSS